MYTLRRSPHNPILTPSAEQHSEMVAFNPSPYTVNGTVELVYRSMGPVDHMLQPPTSISVIARAEEGNDGLFEHAGSFITPTEDFDTYGCEDPRVTFFEGRYYTFYTALSGIPFGPDNIKVACAVSDDMRTVAEKHLVTPFNAKAMTLFPERINGKVVVMFAAHTDDKPVRIAFAEADEVSDFWKKDYWDAWHTELDTKHAVELRRHEDDFVEIGASPLKVDGGWLLIYSYVKDYLKGDSRTFGVEALLLQHDDPHTVAARTNDAMLVPDIPKWCAHYR
jgi:beta-1,2-mannobiose phosphorylase / 1,2-beta-oligomannan phosphorylase